VVEGQVPAHGGRRSLIVQPPIPAIRIVLSGARADKPLTLLSGFGVVIQGPAGFHTGTKKFRYKSGDWSSAVYRYHRSGGEKCYHRETR